jgi:hypothetical protein
MKTCFVMTGEECVSAIEYEGANAPLDKVGVELSAAVIKATGEPIPALQSVTDVLGDHGL